MNDARLPPIVAVIGAGTMGAGIALTFVRGGCEVRLMSRRTSTLEQARVRIEEGLSDGADPLGRLSLGTSVPEAAEGAALIVETVVEDLKVKQALLVEAERMAAAEAVLATDTSSLSIDALAAALDRPERFAGMHWFNPPELIPLIEVVAGAATSDATVDALLAWSRLLGKAPIHVRRDIPGFIGNRLQYALLREAYSLVESGVCTYRDIDDAVRFGLGLRWAGIGPFESMDLAGLDVHAEVAARLYPLLAIDREPSPSVQSLVAEGALGCKTLRGLYGEYSPEQVDALKARRTRVLGALLDLHAEEAEAQP
jgi:3-hydroxyacyl-CoA dehydrogenase